MANSVTMGLGLAVLGYGGRYITRYWFWMWKKFINIFRTTPQLVTKLESVTRALNFQLPKFDMKAWENSKYHKGGFQERMTKREASSILGISPNADAKKISNAHKRVNLLHILLMRNPPLSKTLNLILFRWWSWTTLIEEEVRIWHPRSTRLKIFLASRKFRTFKPLREVITNLQKKTFCEIIS